MRIMITGVAGFAGSHLADYVLAQPDVTVAGIVRTESNLANIAGAEGKLRLCYGDVAEYESIERVFAECRPQFVFHLAGQAAASLAWQRAEQTLMVNVLGQLNVLKAAAELVPDAVVLVVGSGDEYGRVLANELPIGEDNPFRPTNPYAVSKIAQDMLGFQFFASHGLRVVRVRPFNHIGPRQSEPFVTASFASQIAAIEAGRCEPVLRVGNLEAKRDLTDVRDMVRAYWLAAQRGTAGEVYNIGTGRSQSIAAVLDMLLARSKRKIAIEQDPERIRRSDVPEVVCDASKFRRCTGWQPTIPIEQTLSDLLSYWRARVGGGEA